MQGECLRLQNSNFCHSTQQVVWLTAWSILFNFLYCIKFLRCCQEFFAKFFYIYSSFFYLPSYLHLIPKLCKHMFVTFAPSVLIINGYFFQPPTLAFVLFSIVYHVFYALSSVFLFFFLLRLIFFNSLYRALFAVLTNFLY